MEWNGSCIFRMQVSSLCAVLYCNAMYCTVQYSIVLYKD